MIRWRERERKGRDGLGGRAGGKPLAPFAR